MTSCQARITDYTVDRLIDEWNLRKNAVFASSRKLDGYFFVVIEYTVNFLLIQFSGIFFEPNQFEHGQHHHHLPIFSIVRMDFPKIVARSDFEWLQFDSLHHYSLFL